MDSFIKPEHVGITMLEDPEVPGTKGFIVTYASRKVNLATCEGNRRFIPLKNGGMAWRRLVRELQTISPDITIIDFDKEQVAVFVTVEASEGDIEAAWGMISPQVRRKLTDHMVGLYPISPMMKSFIETYLPVRKGLGHPLLRRR